MKKSIAIDMDQVLADFYSKLCNTYNATFEDQFTQEQFLQGTGSSIPPEKMKKLFQFMNEPDYFRNLSLLDPDAVEVVKELQEHYDIFIATAAMDVPGSFTAKYEWLQQYFPFIDTQNIVFCGNKAVVATDYLIDDSPRQLTKFKGTGILYHMPYNAQVTEFERVHNWQEIHTYFMKQL